MRPDALLIDLDNTLYGYSTANNAAKLATEKELSRIVGKPVESVRMAIHEARSITHKNLHGTASSHSRLLYFQRALELLGETRYECLVEIHSLFWDIYFANLVPSEGAKEFLERVSLPKCLVTDFTAELQFRKLAKLGMLGLFDYVVTSEEIGAEKPNPKIFQAALKKLNVQASKAAVIGDDFEKDIRGAVTLGMRAFWFTPAGDDMPASLPGVQSFTSFATLESLIDGR